MFKKLNNWLTPMIAGAFVIFAVAHVLKAQQVPPKPVPPVEPARSPFGSTVAGTGMVEPSTEASSTGNIAVGSQLAGVVTKVAVRIGQEVKVGDLLFEVDPRQTLADLAVREANVPVNEAQVKVAEASLRQMTDQYERAAKLQRTGGIAAQEFVIAEQNYHTARAQLALAKANLDLARAQVDQDRITLALLKVQATVDGTILQVNVRPGEYVSIAGGQSLILMGQLKPLHVRVDIDEHDIPRFKINAPAQASARGSPQVKYPLRFKRVEPYVIPKKSLTGDNTERVDTRVLQVIYELDTSETQPIYVGQQLDVFIDVGSAVAPSESTKVKSLVRID